MGVQGKLVRYGVTLVVQPISHATLVLRISSGGMLRLVTTEPHHWLVATNCWNAAGVLVRDSLQNQRRSMLKIAGFVRFGSLVIT